MSLSTLANVIQTAEPGADAATQTVLKHFLRRANAIVRTRTRRFHGGLIEANTVANPTVITSYGHGLSTGDVIQITESNSTPSIDGEQTVTVLNDDTFSVDENVTAAGSSGYFGKRFTEFYDGPGHAELRLRQVPVLSVGNVWVDPNGYYGQGDGAFGDSTLLTPGRDYVLRMSEAGLSRTGMLLRINGVWPGKTCRRGMMVVPVPGEGNIKAQYVHGYEAMPVNLRLGVELVTTELYKIASRGAALASESIDYYSYSRMTPDDEEKALASAKSLLAAFTTPLV